MSETAHLFTCFAGLYGSEAEHLYGHMITAQELLLYRHRFTESNIHTDLFTYSIWFFVSFNSEPDNVIEYTCYYTAVRFFKNSNKIPL